MIVMDKKEIVDKVVDAVSAKASLLSQLATSKRIYIANTNADRSGIQADDINTEDTIEVEIDGEPVEVLVCYMSDYEPGETRADTNKYKSVSMKYYEGSTKIICKVAYKVF